jgi:fatty-acyl-CoA synthase
VARSPARDALAAQKTLPASSAPTTVVHLRSDHAPSDDELRAHCATELARYKIPKAFVGRDFVQRSPSGKPDYGWARAQLEV